MRAQSCSAVVLQLRRIALACRHVATAPLACRSASARPSRARSRPRTSIDELRARLRGSSRHVAHADALVEHRRVRAGRDLAAAPRSAMPCARNRLLLHHERDELPLRSRLLDPAELLDAGEVLVERARPAQAGRDRVRLRRDVVAVQRVADLEPERVARAEAARGGAARDDGVPELRPVLGRAHQLAAALARVARPVHHHLDAVDLAHRVRELRRLRQLEPLDRARALHGEQRVVVRGVAHLRAARLALLQPRVVRVPVSGVDDEQVVEAG